LFTLTEYWDRMLDEVVLSAIRAQGSGGQNVNKVSSAIHLRFDIRASSLPDWLKSRLLNKQDDRVTNEGIVVIKAQSYRSQPQNKDDALQRLQAIITQAASKQKARIASKPTRASKRRRLDGKARQGQKKATRSKVNHHD